MLIYLPKTTSSTPLPPTPTSYLLPSSKLTITHASQLSSICYFLWDASQHPTLCRTFLNLKLNIDLWDYFITEPLPPKLKAFVTAGIVSILLITVPIEPNVRPGI